MANDPTTPEAVLVPAEIVDRERDGGLVVVRLLDRQRTTAVVSLASTTKPGTDPAERLVWASTFESEHDHANEMRAENARLRSELEQVKRERDTLAATVEALREAAEEDRHEVPGRVPLFARVLAILARTPSALLASYRQRVLEEERRRVLDDEEPAAAPTDRETPSPGTVDP